MAVDVVQEAMDSYVVGRVKELFPEDMTEEEQQEADMVVWTSLDQFKLDGEVVSEGASEEEDDLLIIGENFESGKSIIIRGKRTE